MLLRESREIIVESLIFSVGDSLCNNYSTYDGKDSGMRSTECFYVVDCVALIITRCLISFEISRYKITLSYKSFVYFINVDHFFIKKIWLPVKPIFGNIHVKIAYLSRTGLIFLENQTLTARTGEIGFQASVLSI